MGGDTTKEKPATSKVAAPDPTEERARADPGDATARNYRYQHAYGVVLLVAAARGLRPYVAIWCEQHEDFLAQRSDSKFDGFQIKTSRPELGAWTLNDREFTKTIGRFIDLVAEFGDRIGNLFFVSNTEFDAVTDESGDTKRRGRCPKAFLEHARQCANRSQLAAPFDAAFDELQATCGCEPAALLGVLHRMDLILGPSRGEFDAALSHEHIAKLDQCKTLNAGDLDDFRDALVALVARASSLHVTDPIRHLRPLISATEIDPTLAAKRIVVTDAVRYEAGSPAFHFVGAPILELGKGLTPNVLSQKLEAGDLADQIEYMRERALGAEYTLLEDAVRRPETFPVLLRQIESRVHGEVSEAYLRARVKPTPYGAAMMIEVQERLQQLAAEPDAVGGHGYECLIGVAGLLTDECRAWWSPRFPIIAEPN